MSTTEGQAEKAKPTCVLVLQGGGALGAYHIGAYQALTDGGFAPDWVCGISIGAINAAVIAGNHADMRLRRLEELWDFISWPAPFMPFGGRSFHWLYNTMSNAEALMFGQPNFFVPRPINPYFSPPGPGATSFYDTSPLLFTLRRFADFDLINARTTRLSLGATDIETGEVTFFDNTAGAGAGAIGPEHVMASGSLPPGFPPTKVGKRFYWDGGCVCNTPLEAVLQDQPPGHTVVFMVDLWNAHGPVPSTMHEVQWREKQIQYASRTATHIDAVADKVNTRHMLRHIAQQAPAEIASAVADDPALTIGERLDIVHVVYRPGADQIPSSDAEFSRSSIAERRAAGYHDMCHAIARAPWFSEPKPGHLGALVHRVEKGTVTTRAHPDLAHTTGVRGQGQGTAAEPEKISA